MSIPDAKIVRQALRQAKKTVALSLKGLNQQAAKSMERGNYDAAARLAEKGKLIQAFQTELDALEKRWKELAGRSGRTESRNSRSTPLWQYYQPILNAIIDHGGDAIRSEIEPQVQNAMHDLFVPGDSDVMGRGQRRWQVMIRRARRHLVQEGWLDGTNHLRWKITDAGRQAAKAELNFEALNE